MKKILLNHSLAIIALSLTLSFNSIGFAASTSTEEVAAIVTTQDDAAHYQIMVDNQSSSHFECLLIKSDIHRARVISRLAAYCWNGKKQPCPSEEITSITFSEKPADGSIHGQITFAVTDLSTWKSFAESSKNSTHPSR